MKHQWWIAPACLVAGIWIGRMGVAPASAGEGSASAGRADGKSMERRTSERSAGAASAYGRLRSEIRGASPVRMAELLKRALLHPDALERRALVIACFEGMDATNWLGMYRQFTEVTRESGVIHPTDQRMSLMVVGRSGGQEAAEWFKENAGPEQLREVVWGWAQEDPAAAVTWLNAGPVDDPALRHRLLSVALGGAAHRDGIAAESMLDALPLEDRLACVSDFTWNLAQRDGMDAAVEWTVKANQRAGADPAYTAKIAANVVDRILDACEEVEGTRGAADRMARIIASDATQADKMKLFVARLPADQPFEFLAGISKTPMAASGEMKDRIEGHLSHLAATRKQAALDWLAKHPDDPLAAELRTLVR